MDALIAQKTFDEDQLIKDNKDANFVKHLAVHKRYLYELILQSLAHFGQKTVEDKVLTKLTAAKVLIGKGLLKAATRELQKGQKIASTYELFDLQLMLYGLKKKLLSRQPLKRADDQAIQEIFEAEQNSLEQLKNTNEYWYLAQQIAQFQTKFQKIQSEEQEQYLKRITQSPQFNTQALATNFKSQVHFHQANATYQFMLGNVVKAYEINQNFLDLLDAHPHFLQLYAEHYLATLNNILIDSLVMGKYEALEEGIERLSLLPNRPAFKSIKNIASQVFRQRYLLLINWSIKQRDFAKALDWIPELEKGLEQFGKKIAKHHRITFYYLTAYVLFQNGRYEQSLSWTNLILNDSKEDVVKEIYYFARILNLLIHYELQNFTLLESLLLSTPKYLKSRRAIYATENALFRFLGKLLNLIDKAAQQKLFADFTYAISNLAKQPSEQRIFNYLDLRLWLEGKP